MRKLAVFILWSFSFSLNLLYAQIQVDSAKVLLDSIANQTFQVKGDSIVLNDSLGSISTQKKPSSVMNYFFKKDSLDVYTYSFYPDDSINYINLQYLDTTNHDADQYDPAKRFDVSYNNLGPIGSAQQNQVFTPSSDLGFQYGIHAFDVYLWKQNNLKLFDIRSPYTKLFYLMGSKKENVLKLAHAQSFLDQQVTAQMEFQLYNHLGFYERQHTDAKSFRGGMGYRTKNNRYQANFIYYHNKIINEENGGIFDLLDFEENRENNRQIIPINLENAENLIRISGITIKQDFHLSKPEPDLSQIPDTNFIEYDAYTVIHYKKPWFAPVSHFGKLSYRFNYERENYLYTDSDQHSELYDSIPVWSDTDNKFNNYTLPFYPNPDSSKIFDSVTVRKYTNEIVYSNSDYKDDALNPKFLNYFAGLRNDYTYWNQACFGEKKMTHNTLIGGVFINLSRYISLTGDAAYYVGDYSNNDFQLNGKIYLTLKGNRLSGGIKINHRSPDYIYQEFTSSRLRWNNEFGKTDQQTLFIKFERKNLWVKARVLNISNYLYFDEAYQPKQEGENIQHIVIEARKNIRLGNWGGDFRLTFQTVSNSEVIRIPELTGKAKLFYHNFFFNNELDMELGAEVYYFTEYYADSYIPLLRSWHIQNVQSIGNYPFVDLYFNAKIGKARLFVRYDNLNANFMDNTYYASPGYPGLDPMFRFGVSWILFN